jgi:membrane associated rhomboid family serine protease
MFLPIRTDSPLRRTPYMNFALIAANFICYIIQQSLGRQKIAPFVLNHANLHLYSYFTYQFLHGDPWHIIGNMLFLYIFGNNVNDKLGNLGYLAFYLAGGVFAGIGFVVMSGTSVIGASGAVAAITGAYLVLFPRSHITILYFFFLIGTYEVPCIWFIAFFFAQDVVLNMIHVAGMQNVAHTAHIAGTMFGFAVCISLLAARMLPRDQFDIVALIQRWNRRRTYRDMVSQGYNPFGYAPEVAQQAPRQTFDPNMERIQDMRAAISDAVSHQDLSRAAQLYLNLLTIDPQQVLARQTQLDVANQLASNAQYREAANAYESLLRFYRNAEQAEQVELMLGLIYARYLSDRTKARSYLTSALEKLHGQREIDLARAELSKLGA